MLNSNWNTGLSPLFIVYTCTINTQLICPWFHCFFNTRQWWGDKGSPPQLRGNHLSSTNTFILPAQTTRPLCWDKVNPNTMMGFVSRGRLFIDTIKLISRGPYCNILMCERCLAAQRALFIFTMPSTAQGAIQHKQRYQILPRAFQASANNKPELNSSPTKLKEQKYHFNQWLALRSSPVPSVNTS